MRKPEYCAANDTCFLIALRNMPRISGPGQRQRDERNSATPLSANLSAYAERFGRSIKDECLDRMIIVGQASLRRAVAEYMDHYHWERNHQGLGNRLIYRNEPIAANDGPIYRRRRLGGMLNFYHREAA